MLSDKDKEFLTDRTALLKYAVGQIDIYMSYLADGGLVEYKSDQVAFVYDLLERSQFERFVQVLNRESDRRKP